MKYTQCHNSPKFNLKPCKLINRYIYPAQQKDFLSVTETTEGAFKQNPCKRAQLINASSFPQEHSSAVRHFDLLCFILHYTNFLHTKYILVCTETTFSHGLPPAPLIFSRDKEASVCSISVTVWFLSPSEWLGQELRYYLKYCCRWSLLKILLICLLSAIHIQ